MRFDLNNVIPLTFFEYEYEYALYFSPSIKNKTYLPISLINSCSIPIVVEVIIKRTNKIPKLKFPFDIS
jgi:hypothetical protein